MLKSILTSALRNIVRNRSFSLINLIGLSVSMSLGLLIIMVIREQYTYDNFHNDIDRIYRVNTRALRVEGGTEPYASTPLPIGQVFLEDYTFSDKVVRINRGLRGDAVYGNVNVPINGFFTDPAFLEVFNFPLEKGNHATALNEPNSLVLSKPAAAKIFGAIDPLGQTVTLVGYGEFQVTGVLKELPSKTHLEFEILVSMSSFPVLEKEGRVSKSLENWNNYYSNYIYFKLKEGRQTSEVDEALAVIAKKYYANLPLETRDKGYEFYLMNLGELTPGPIMSNQMGSGVPMLLIIFLSVLVGIVMVMACFNYTNLMIAKSLSRAREIGVRKVVGAQRFQVFFQFVGEAVVFAVIALGFSYLLLQALKPAFLQLNIAREFQTSLAEGTSIYLYFLLFAIGVGVIAGLLPAGYLSAFKPVSVLKDSGNVKVYSRLAFRKTLIVAQFTFSLAFIIVVLVIYKQADYMVNANYGIHDENVLNVRLQGVEFEKLANEVRNVPGVVRVGGVSHRLGTWQDGSSDYKVSLEAKPFEIRDFMVDDNYISNLKLQFLAGQNFNAAEQGKFEKHVILNEKALGYFNLKDPVSAIGQVVYTDDTVQLKVIGVVKNFNFRPLTYEIGPLALRYRLRSLNHLSAEINPREKESIVAALETIWKKVDPIHPLEWKMMNQEIDDAYTDSGLMDVVKIVGYISFLAITLACLGMLGMAMYSTRTRIKEIGVRKVMGADSSQIVFLLSRSFMYLIGIAIMIGGPLGYFLGDLFLTTAAYKIQISPMLILSSLMIIISLGIITIGSQTWRAASSNPVKALRYE